MASARQRPPLKGRAVRPENGEGPGALRRTPHSYRHQPACKPGSVGPRPLARARRDGHSSGTTLARCLEQPTRIASLTPLPRALSLSRTTRVAIPIRSCSRWGLPCRFRCRTRGALLPHLFTLAAPPLREGKRFVLCGTFPGVAPAGCYPAPYVDGARTFLSLGLSAFAGAAVRPTDLQGMRSWGGGVKPLSALRDPKINYPEDVVLPVAVSTGCRRSSRSKGVTRCSIF